ncbi:MAG TPA: A/G-specific adenine glycosylase [Pseudolabrys sp.]|nr:A/G-specific adenine glycosylase [Pseudolabrys sp.]
MSLAAEAGRKKKSVVPSAQEPAAMLLAWYDRHRRSLPWRAPPGVAADPYRVWLSEIMLQQTTVRAVAPYYMRFTEKWPTVETLANASLDDVLRAWAGLGYYARARNLHACAQAVVARHGGVFPRSEEALRTLPGIGAYTAAAIGAIAFDAPAAAVDGNVERVITRLYAIEEELPAAKPRVRAEVEALLPTARTGDFAQALMDLGATLCTPKKPSCILCPWMQGCAARARGDAESFPRKAEKREGKLRRGAAFVAVRADDHVLVRTRPEKGLLGGMTEVPGSAWATAYKEKDAVAAAPKFPRAVAWRRIPGVVTHVFTHFPLELAVFIAKIPAKTSAPAETRWVPLAHVSDEALPNVMRKVLAHAVDGRKTRIARR